MNKRFILSVFTFILLFCLSSCSKLTGLKGNEDCDGWITYNGVKYIRDCFFCAAEDKKYLGRAENGACVYTVGNRNDPVYIVIDGSDNTGCYIKEGFSVPTSGTVTKVLVDPYVRGSNKNVVSKQEELNIVAELAAIEGEVQEFTVENYYTEGNAFYYVYDGSNVSTGQNYGGYIAYVNGCWIYSAPGMKIQIDQRVSNTAVVEAVIIKDPELLTGICKTDLVKWIKR